VFSREGLNHLLVRLFRWYGLLLHGDQTIVDRWLWLRKRLRRGEARVLDAGCGSGTFALYAAKQGNEVVGLNWDDRDVQAAESRARMLGLSNTTFRPQDLRTVDRIVPELGSFDQILCFEVVEHLIDDGKLVRDLAGMLRPGGTLLLTTPSDDHKKVPGEYISEVEDGGHVRYGYSHDDLRRLAEQAGLQVTALGHLVGPLSQGLFRAYFQLGQVNGLLGWLATVPFRPFPPLLDGLLGRILPIPPYCVSAVLTRPAAAV
jgi:2-polyprenyl-3-methyl-5-hydroxy-6-metoxy-1,4-benzoquinol methylase